MNRGKHTCEYLKDVRRRVARENDIPLEQPACTFEGECSGTCPRCEAEVRYIESELRKRRSLGKAVSIAGIALSSVVAVSCHPNTLQGEPELNPDDTVNAATDTTAVNDTLRNNCGEEHKSQQLKANSQSYSLCHFASVVTLSNNCRCAFGNCVPLRLIFGIEKRWRKSLF